MDAFKDLAKALGVVLIVAATLILAVYLGMKVEAEMGDAGKSLSSWVQAVGSIAAILGAWFAMRYQLEQSAKHRRRSIVAIAGAAKARADEISGYLNGKDPRVDLLTKFHQSIIDGLVNALNGAPVDEIGSPEAVAAFLEMQYQVVLLGVAVEQYVKGPWGDPEFQASMDKMKEQGYDGDEMMKVKAARWRMLTDNLQNRVKWIDERYAALTQAVAKL